MSKDKNEKIRKNKIIIFFLLLPEYELQLERKWRREIQEIFRRQSQWDLLTY